MKELIQSFIAVLSTAKGYSENTCRSYRSDLLEFADIIKHIGLSDTTSRRMPQSETLAPDAVTGIAHPRISRASASTLQKIDDCSKIVGGQVVLPLSCQTRIYRCQPFGCGSDTQAGSTHSNISAHR